MIDSTRFGINRIIGHWLKDQLIIEGDALRVVTLVEHRSGFAWNDEDPIVVFPSMGPELRK